jgi:hypothetical protein
MEKVKKITKEEMDWGALTNEGVHLQDFPNYHYIESSQKNLSVIVKKINEVVDYLNS